MTLMNFRGQLIAWESYKLHTPGNNLMFWRGEWMELRERR